MVAIRHGAVLLHRDHDFDVPVQPVSPALGTAIALSAAAVLVLGILPNLLVQYAPVSTLVAGP